MQTNPLGNFPIDKFLSEYWQKKPLLIHNALPNIASPITADELAGLACEEEVESRIVIQDKATDKWELKHGPFNDKTFSTLPASHWTLLVQAVDHWLPDAAKFLDQFAFIPRWRIDDLMISYANDGGGVGPHFDHYDVFLVQTNGKRKWEVGELCNEKTPFIKDLPVSILSEFSSIHSWTLEPGDILYLPPGYAHNGTAVGDDCITCSVGFRAPSHSDVLCEYVDFISGDISEAMRFNDPDLIAQNNSGEINQHALDQIQDILRQYADDKELIKNWFGHYATRPKYDLTTDLSNNSCSLSELKEYLQNNGKLVRNESSRFAYQTTNHQHKLFIDGEIIASDDNVNSLIEILCSKIELSNDMFDQSDINLKLILKLLKRGVLYLP